MSRSHWLIWRYYAFRVTNSAGFYVPVAIIFLEHRGFSLGFIGLVYAVFSFAMVAAEIPTGYLGDWLGRRGSLVVGSTFRVVTLAAYPFVDSKLAYVALHVTWAMGWAFRSGTIDAWLYEVLQARFDESEYARIEGRGSTALLVTSAVTAIAGGVLYSVDPSLPFLANAALAAVGIPILFTFPAIGTDAGDGDADARDADDGDADARDAGDGDADARDADDDVFTVREAVRMLRLQVGRPAVRWLVVYAALFQGLFSVTRTFEQPAVDAVGLPVAGLGVLYAGFKLVSAGAASTAGWFEDRLGTRGVFALLVPAYGFAYVSVALSPVLVVPLLFFNRSLRVVTRPVRNQYLNDRLGNVGRATVLSGASMVLSLASGTANLLGGRVVERFGPVEFLPWVGVTVAVVAGLLWLATSPVRPLAATSHVDDQPAPGTD